MNLEIAKESDSIAGSYYYLKGAMKIGSI